VRAPFITTIKVSTRTRVISVYSSVSTCLHALVLVSCRNMHVFVCRCLAVPRSRLRAVPLLFGCYHDFNR
jgi:hypothetical protein